MNTFQSSDLFGAFLVFVAIFLIIILLDWYYHQCTSKDVEKPIYGQHHSLRFQVKKMFARLLLKLGKKEQISHETVDKLQVFSDADLMPVDAVYFNTSSAEKQILVFATARRKNGLINTIGFLKVPEFSSNLLVLPVYPLSSLYQTKEEQNVLDYYTVAGIKITPVVPHQEYRIEYNGKMHLESVQGREVDIRLSAVWRSDLPTFNFSTEISKPAMVEAMALEPWSHQYFNNLKSHHQTHFEQYGSVDGVVEIDGKKYLIKTNGIRDRTIGAHRNWNDFHQYVIHYIHLSNGNAITIGVISMPVMFTRLVIGFVTSAKDSVNIPIDNCSINLNDFIKHDPPQSYEFDFITDNDSYRVHVNRHTKGEMYMGEQSECCLIETWCDYKVNGVRGWGAAEWQYRNDKNIA